MFHVVFLRELGGLARSAWAPWLLLGPLAFCSALVVLRWPTDGVADSAGERALQAFRLFAYALLAGVLLLAPAAPATTLVEQRRRGTLALLLNTPLTGRAIYLGLLLAGVVAALLPTAMTLPAAAACYALGSLDAIGQLAALYGVLFASAVQCTTIALAISCRAQSPVSAVRWTYATVLLTTVGCVGPAWLALRGGQAPGAWASALQTLSPLPALLELTGQADLLGGGTATERGAVVKYLLSAAVLSAALAALVIRQLRPGLTERARDAGVITDDRTAQEQRWRRLLYLVDPQRRSRGIPDWMNPVLAKEFRTRRFGRGSWTLRLLAACAMLSLGAALAATTGAIRWSTESIGGFLVQLQVALMLVATPSLASGLISDELENGCWPLLRMTPLSGWRIAWGKILSTLASVMLLLLATLPGYAVIMLIKPVMTRQVLTVLATLALTGLFCIALSAALSSLLRRTARATLVSYAVLIAVFGGTLAIWSCRDAPFGPPVVEAALSINPVAAALGAIEAPGFAGYHLLPRCWYYLTGATLTLLVVLAVQTRRLALPD